MVERTILETPRVKVTTRRALISGKTYALDNIVSVEAHTKPADTTWGIMLVVVGAASLIGFFILVMDPSNPSPHICGGVGFVGVTLGSVLWATAKPFHSLRITTNAGPQFVMWDRDREVIDEVVEALNRAIATAREEVVVLKESPTVDPLAQIAKLKKLLDAGALTQDEFDLKKSALLMLV